MNTDSRLQRLLQLLRGFGGAMMVTLAGAMSTGARKAVVLLSGGLDSATVLAIVKETRSRVCTCAP